jgi:hypothetical protein
VVNNRPLVYLTTVLALALVVGITACGASKQATTSDPDGGALLSDTRSRLSICVADETGSVVGDDALETFKNALNDALSGANVPPEYDESHVVSGCPQSLVKFGTPVSKYELPSRTVDKPSEHRLLTYFVPDTAFSATFGQDAYVSSPVEFTCTSDVCVPATLGLFLPASASKAVVRDGLLDALYLLPAEPHVDPTIPPERCLATSPHGGCDQLRPGDQ